MTMVRQVGALAALSILVVSGCVSQQAQRIETDLAAVRDSLHAANTREEDLRQDIEVLGQRLDEHEDLFSQLRADHETDVDEIRSELTVAQTHLSENDDRFAALSLRMDAMERRTHGRSPIAAADSAQPALPGDMKQMYDRAYLDFTRKKYDLAISGFSEFLKSFPETELADNAQYWIGECHYVQGRFEEAIPEFQRVLDRYPDGNKAPGAMLKIGYCQVSLGQNTAAIRQLKTVIERYPGTPEAEQARAKLPSLTP